MNAPAALIILLLCIGLIGRISLITYLVLILPVFGSLALLPPELTGGGSILPGSVAAVFLIAKGLSFSAIRKDAISAMANFGQLGFLTLFLIVAVFGAFTLPQVFNGEIQAFTMKSGYPEFIAPSMSNFTQAAYLTLSTLTAVIIAALIRNQAFANMLPKAILAGGCAVIATGVMDVVANHFGMEEFLSYFRTANYMFLTNNEIMGIRRIIGLMPEASAYGSMAAGFCGLLLFLRPIFSPLLRRWFVPMVAWGCGVMALISTSSSAYAMMAVVMVLYAFYNVCKISPEGSVKRKTIIRKIIAFIIMMIIGLYILQFSKGLMSHFMELIDTLIFQKSSSSSYADRSSWTAAALDAFFESHGIGVGAGSVRTSNFFVNILASTGVPGAILFVLFLAVIFTRKAPPSHAHGYVMILASKLALIPMFAGAALIGTTPDFGIVEGALFGIIAGLGYSPTKYARKQDQQSNIKLPHTPDISPAK